MNLNRMEWPPMDQDMIPSHPPRGSVERPTIAHINLTYRRFGARKYPGRNDRGISVSTLLLLTGWLLLW
jgi:hypothetical protein